jgi:hypothetical protein
LRHSTIPSDIYLEEAFYKKSHPTFSAQLEQKKKGATYILGAVGDG